MPCGFGDRCMYRHYKTRRTANSAAPAVQERPDAAASSLTSYSSGPAGSSASPNIAADPAQPTPGTYVCCFWLEGKCQHAKQHRDGQKLYLHKDLPGMPCEFGDECPHLHHERTAAVDASTRTLAEQLPQGGIDTEPALDIFVCCLWLRGKCIHKKQHRLGKHLYLHEDVPGMPCGFRQECKYLHHKSRLPEAASEPKTADVDVQLQTGMLVFVQNPHALWGIACNVSASPVNVRWGRKASETGRFTVEELRVPDYSDLGVGKKLAVWSEGKEYDCTVLDISHDSHTNPVLVHYNGYSPDCDEWVGADRMRSKFVKLVQPKLPVISSGHSCEAKAAHQLQPGMVVWFAGRDSEIGGMVLEVSAEVGQAVAPVSVRWGRDPSETGRFTVEELLVPDYSDLGVGKKLAVWSEGKEYDCTVLDISHDSHTNPVLVHYNGYSPDCDEWVGADRMRSKFVKLVQPKLPVISSGHSCEAKAAHQLQPGMVVWFAGRDSEIGGMVLEVSAEVGQAAAPVSVRWGRDPSETGRFTVEELRVPDYSDLGVGKKLAVWSEGKEYDCTVLDISHDSHTNPVLVHYNGYSPDCDEWVGADRMRSKFVKLVQPKSPLLSAELGAAVEPDMKPLCQPAKTREARQNSDTRELPSLPDGACDEQASEPMPWHEPESEDDEDAVTCLELAINAVARVSYGQVLQPAQKRILEEALCPAAASSLVRNVLAMHGWLEKSFSSVPDVQKLYEHLLKTRSDLFEDATGSSCCGDDVSNAEISEGLADEAASSCAMQAENFDELLARQSSDIHELTGTLICGTFRCVAGSSEGKLKHCGEVLVERGPGPLIGCKVRIPPGKNRGHAWDCDRCYVRILVAGISVAILLAPKYAYHR